MRPDSGFQWPSKSYCAAVLGLMLVLGAELALSVRQESQTSDEAVHLLAGYQYWRHRDFGANPEHPPLVKLVAALPLLFLDLKETPVLEGPTKPVHGAASVGFLYHNNIDADAMLFRARMAVSVFTFLLAALVLVGAYEMLGPGPALLALALLVFEPNLLAHGALITTDMGVTCFVFATVYAFYRYVKRPSAARLVVCGIATFLALASKHSALIVLPTLVLLAVPELWRRKKVLLQTAPPKKNNRQKSKVRKKAAGPEEVYSESFARHAGRWVLALAAIGAMACIGLWTIYTFRYAARPAGAELNPLVIHYVPLVPGVLGSAIRFLDQTHLLPESYLWGLTDVAASESRVTFILGKIYDQGQWFYFPVVFAMKATLGFLALLAASLFGFRRWGLEWRFLVLPPVVWLTVSMMSGMNIGIRHILPIFPFLILIAAGTAGAWMLRSRRAAYAVGALLVAHAASSLHVFPNYLTYANEAIGGPAKGYRLMSDSNVDWGQGLKQVASYLQQHHVTNCWFTDRNGEADRSFYHIPCKHLSTFYLPDGSPPGTRAMVEGPLLVGAFEAAGQGWGPAEINPYRQFLDKQPDAMIGNSILVFNGKFDLSHVAALNHAHRAQGRLDDNRPEEALPDAQLAIQLAPQSAETQAILCRALVDLKRTAEANETCDLAFSIAQRVHPEYQFTRLMALQYLQANIGPSWTR